MAMFFVAAITVTAAFGRLCYYLMIGMPPISLLGRVATGRLILPGYDKIFIAPVCAAGLALVMANVHSPIFTMPAWAGITSGFVSAVLLAGGPTLADWKLTGEYRINSMHGTDYVRV